MRCGGPWHVGDAGDVDEPGQRYSASPAHRNDTWHRRLHRRLVMAGAAWRLEGAWRATPRLGARDFRPVWLSPRLFHGAEAGACGGCQPDCLSVAVADRSDVVIPAGRASADRSCHRRRARFSRCRHAGERRWWLFARWRLRDGLCGSPRLCRYLVELFGAVAPAGCGVE